MSGRRVYLDSSALVKRYVKEKDSDIVKGLYKKAYSGEVTLITSLWNVGEVLGVFDRKRRQGFLDEETYAFLRRALLADVKRLSRLGVLEVVPVHSLILVDAWKLIERHHIYQADALQIVSAKHEMAEEFYTSDKRLHKVAVKEGLNSILLE
ncbi:PilT protein domain protein [Pyrococcus sp. NA2]|uniref:type II toxin-antitoxin system VapC family toxin n=1 Tax=Pyrococcus sp. (strain NA2) TaxID=342949 RepID=UPI000209B033|nr:type II toxin-antitoxin system VapC family toxin [Pyrococcus sp. NA2]AEC51200.1 PilT protein domain protein [Pyrococcus sp. NA2]